MTYQETYDQLVWRAQRAQDHERREIFNELITRFEQAGYHWAFRLLNEREAAEDAVQEAALNAFLHLDQLQEPKAFPAWFRQILTNTCRRMIQRERPARPLDRDDETQPDPVDPIEEGEKRDSVDAAVLKLPEHERVVTQLFYYDDYSQSEIADTLEVPVTTVKKRLQYARARLKSLIGQDFMSAMSGYFYALNGGCTAAALEFTIDVPDFPVEDAMLIEMAVPCAY